MDDLLDSIIMAAAAVGIGYILSILYFNQITSGLLL